MEDEIIKKIGQELVGFSKEVADFTKRRGLAAELFPYIYEASKRMSTRAIVSWLKEKYKIELSAVTVARVLRHKTYHAKELMEEVMPYAISFAQSHRKNVKEVLLMDYETFEKIFRKEAHIKAPHEDKAESFWNYEDAAYFLELHWFPLEKETRSYFSSLYFKEKEISKEGVKREKKNEWKRK